MKLVVLGDAAHAMLPYMSQGESHPAFHSTLSRTSLGAAIAVEDGVALAYSLNKVQSQTQITTGLSVFEKVRVKRASQMQEASLLNGKL